MRFATIADKELVERICNDPFVRLWTACDGAPLCDATKYLAAPSFVVLVDDRGCFLAHCIEPGRYVIHTNLLPSCRGNDAVEAAREAMQMAFVLTDAVELLTMVPANNPQAKMFARHLGFGLRFTRQSLWPYAANMYDMGFYSLSLDDWVMSGACRDGGELFHKRLQEQCTLPAHRHDPAHDAAVGAAALMIGAGNVSKAVAAYNRWARFALYEPIQVVSEEPLRIDIRQCVLRVEGDQFFVEAPHA